MPYLPMESEQIHVPGWSLFKILRFPSLEARNLDPVEVRQVTVLRHPDDVALHVHRGNVLHIPPANHGEFVT